MPSTGLDRALISRTISTSAPLTGGGDLSADRTIGLANQLPHYVFIGPSSGSTAGPVITRPLIAADIPATLASHTFTGAAVNDLTNGLKVNASPAVTTASNSTYQGPFTSGSTLPLLTFGKFVLAPAVEGDDATTTSGLMKFDSDLLAITFVRTDGVPIPIDCDLRGTYTGKVTVNDATHGLRINLNSTTGGGAGFNNDFRLFEIGDFFGFDNTEWGPATTDWNHNDGEIQGFVDPRDGSYLPWRGSWLGLFAGVANLAGGSTLGVGSYLLPNGETITVGGDGSVEFSGSIIATNDVFPASFHFFGPTTNQTTDARPFTWDGDIVGLYFEADASCTVDIEWAPFTTGSPTWTSLTSGSGFAISSGNSRNLSPTLSKTNFSESDLLRGKVKTAGSATSIHVHVELRREL